MSTCETNGAPDWTFVRHACPDGFALRFGLRPGASVHFIRPTGFWSGCRGRCCRPCSRPSSSDIFGLRLAAPRFPDCRMEAARRVRLSVGAIGGVFQGAAGFSAPVSVQLPKRVRARAARVSSFTILRCFSFSIGNRANLAGRCLLSGLMDRCPNPRPQLNVAINPGHRLHGRLGNCWASAPRRQVLSTE